MNWLRSLLTLAAFALVVGLGVAAFLTRDTWRAWLIPAKPAAEPKAADHGPRDRIKLTDQAQKNLGLIVDAALPEPFTRSLLIPGIIVDRPGLSDRGVVSQVAGVVTKVALQPGDTVQPGQALFTIRLLSEVFQQSQNELFKANRDLVLAKEMVARLKGADGVLPANRVIEAEATERRLKASITAYRQELLTRGLRPEQIDGIGEGKFVTEITVAAPAKAAEERTPSESAAKAAPNLEVKEVRVQLGEQVQAGQVLAMLANHQTLYIEGRAFKSEATLLENAAQSGWKVKLEFAEEAGGWPAFDESPTIRHLANVVDPASRTFAFYLPLTNQSRSYAKESQTFLVWRFRPGQRVRLLVPIEKYPTDKEPEVFVFPSAAVVREGPDAYVFRQSGDVFQQRPVHVLFEEQDTVVIANDGSISPGDYIARNGAGALLRAIKAKAAASGGEDPHAGHTH